MHNESKSKLSFTHLIYENVVHLLSALSPSREDDYNNGGNDEENAS